MKIQKRDAPQEPLTLKYRPQELDDVVGQLAATKSIQSMLSKPHPHAFLFTGPSGVGKTTLARIVARLFEASDVIQIDAASYSGVEAVRGLTANMSFKSLGGGNKFIIVDECHSLSKSAWQALLASTEEPPAHVYWAFCTTEPEKVPSTIKTRCACYALKPIKPSDIADYLDKVAEIEGITLAANLLGIIARKANGSMRQALSFLQVCSGAETKEEVLALIEAAEAAVPVIELARLICLGQGLTWERAAQLVKNLEETNYEGVRLTIINYVTQALLGAKGEKEVTRLANILQCFSGSYNASEGKAPLLLSLASLLYGN